MYNLTGLNLVDQHLVKLNGVGDAYQMSVHAKQLFERIVEGTGTLAERQESTRILLHSFKLSLPEILDLERECRDHGVLSARTIYHVFMGF